ncbi:MAG: hypothetical protein WBC44_19570 [Planctomycetaceae bacterium]
MSVAGREYICPGERYVIPRAVHRARLAAGFAACGECPLRFDGKDDSSGASIDRESEPAIRAARPRRLFTAEGVRGVARNEVDGATAERLATALAVLLWEEIAATAGRPPANGFPVVVGYDDRAWSLQSAVAAGTALRRCGCETIDVGLVTGPEFRFAVAHLEAAAGVLATGAGGGPAVAGLEFVRSAGRPLSAGGGLDELADVADRVAGRPTRRGGRRREFNVAVPYEAGLKRHVATARTAAGVVGTSSPLIRRRIERLAAELSPTLRTCLLARRALDDSGSDETGLATIAVRVREARADFGLWIGEDGGTCRVVDESGTVVSVADLAALLISDALAERPGAPVVVDWPLAERLAGTALRREEVVRSNGTAEAMWLSMRDHAAAAGADSAGRFWSPGSPATSDAFVTLARLLRALPATEKPLSKRLSRSAERPA